jgi:hypothetical protein
MVNAAMVNARNSRANYAHFCESFSFWVDFCISKTPLNIKECLELTKAGAASTASRIGESKSFIQKQADSSLRPLGITQDFYVILLQDRNAAFLPPKTGPESRQEC